MHRHSKSKQSRAFTGHVQYPPYSIAGYYYLLHVMRGCGSGSFVVHAAGMPVL